MPKKKRSSFLSIIIVSYNTQDLTLQTVKSVIADINRSVQNSDKVRLELIVVDNNDLKITRLSAKLTELHLKNYSLKLS